MADFITKLRAPSLKPEDLLKAVYSRDIRKVKDILSVRPDLVNAKAYNDPVFYHTCEFDKIEMCRLFISNGAQVTGGALHHAIFLAGNEIVKLLLDAGAQSTEKNSKGQTPFHNIWSNSDSVAVIALLIARGADINAKDNSGATPLHDIASNGRDRWIKDMVNAGADVNAKDNMGKTPLHYAIERGGVSVTETLLQYKADPNLADAEEKTPFDYALLLGQNGHSHTRVLQKYGGKARSAAPERLLPKTFTVDLPEITREGHRLYATPISSFTDVIGALHAWYDNDCRSLFGTEKASLYIKSIGEELNRQGGFNLMSEVANAVDREYHGLGVYLNNDWDRIGSWHA